MRRLLICGLLCLTVVAVLYTSAAYALPVGYTSQADFMTAISGYSQKTLDFDSQAAGTTIASGDTVEGITFTYDFGGVEMAITDGNQFGGGGPFSTTSPPNFLGTTDFDVFLDGDNFDLSFAAVNAIGLSFITLDPMFDGDITLTVGTTSAGLVAADIQQTLPDGSNVYFLGIVDDTNSFTTASITNIGGGYFFYNVDDITTAVVPEPGTFVLFSTGLLGTFLLRRRRSS